MQMCGTDCNPEDSGMLNRPRQRKVLRLKPSGKQAKNSDDAELTCDQLPLVTDDVEESPDDDEEQEEEMTTSETESGGYMWNLILALGFIAFFIFLAEEKVHVCCRRR